jgi:crossover junction endodeoxyribonuclease RusA
MSRQTAELQVIGIEPAPQGSKRYVGNGRFIEASKKLGPFRNAVGQAVLDLYEATGDPTHFTKPVEVTATFILPKPKTVKRLWPSVVPDTDKLMRALGDSLSLEKYGQLIEDDSLIVQWHAEKIYGTREEMGVIVGIELANAPWHMMPLDFTEQ